MKSGALVGESKIDRRARWPCNSTEPGLAGFCGLVGQLVNMPLLPACLAKLAASAAVLPSEPTAAAPGRAAGEPPPPPPPACVERCAA